MVLLILNIIIKIFIVNAKLTFFLTVKKIICITINIITYLSEINVTAKQPAESYLSNFLFHFDGINDQSAFLLIVTECPRYDGPEGHRSPEFCPLFHPVSLRLILAQSAPEPLGDTNRRAEFPQNSASSNDVITFWSKDR